MTRRFEKGNVVGFALIGVLLTAMLIGGVWLARHPIGSSTQVASDLDTVSTDTNTDEDKSTDSTSTTDEELKEALSKQADKSTPSQTASPTLPNTGPADVLLEMVGITLLTGTAVAYVRSRSVA